MSIRKRLTVTSSALLIFAVMQALIAIHGFFSVKGDVQRLKDDTLPGIQYIDQFSIHLNQLRAAEAQHIASSSDAEIRDLEAEMTSARKQMTSDLALYEKYIGAEEDRQNFVQIRPLLEKMDAGWTAVLPLSRAQRMKRLMLFSHHQFCQRRDS